MKTHLISWLVLSFSTVLPASQSDPSHALWYDKPATSWSHEALPIGNGRIGAMVFGGIGRERIALNEKSVWSGQPNEWNRENASKNLGRIRELLIKGKNEEAEALVNQSFTCTGGGSRGGARGPWGCFQELGNLRLEWAFEAKPMTIADWKYQKIITPGDGNERDRYRATKSLVQEWVKQTPGTGNWTDYRIETGKDPEGGFRLEIGDRVMLFSKVHLTRQQLQQLGTLVVDPGTKCGEAYVNGVRVGEFPGWQAIGHDPFSADVSAHLKEGENTIGIYAHNYRRRGQMPAYVKLEPKTNTTIYRRQLDLSEAISSVQYTLNGVTYKREAFSSAPDEVMVFRFTADKPGKISFTAGLDRLERFTTQSVGSDSLLMTGSTRAQGDKDGMKFAARAKALHSGGKVRTNGNRLVIDSADEAILLVSAATNYQGFAGRGTADPVAATLEDLRKIESEGYAELRASYVADHRSYYDRMSLELGDGTKESVERALAPTNQRLASLAEGNPDPALAALYFHFGRYLMISSSRPGAMPANLQGLWAEGIQTPWNCDYHIDVNVQMNYWPAEATALGDCHTPLFKLIESLQNPGAKTARTYYDAKGWVAHVITNVWGFTAPGEQAGWGGNRHRHRMDLRPLLGTL